jgi:hypothetical protein
MKTHYSFSVIRYVHDTVSGEYVNVGIVVYAPELRYIKARCTTRHSRVSSMFQGVDGTDFRLLMHYVETQINKLGERFASPLDLMKKEADVLDFIRTVITFDDSALQFSTSGGGLTIKPDVTLESLFDRYVNKYMAEKPKTTRYDEDVWKVFKQSFERNNVLKRLREHSITTPQTEYVFEHSWKNDIWHCLEPVSFDYADPRIIREKAERWFGKTYALSKAKESFKLYYLIGKPRNNPSSQITKAIKEATSLLKETPVEHELVGEEQALVFAKKLLNEMEKHETASE